MDIASKQNERILAAPPFEINRYFIVAQAAAKCVIKPGFYVLFSCNHC